jgi:hypothetical protein
MVTLVDTRRSRTGSQKHYFLTEACLTCDAICSTGPTAIYNFPKLPGQDYVQAIRVIIRDTGSTNPGKTYQTLVYVYDRSNCGESGEHCPPQ